MKIQTFPFKIKIAKDLPSKIGVYIFFSGEKIIYVGKSINIKARIASHIENAKTDQKEFSIVDGADKIGYYETDSEFKALVLESRLIQQNKPQYNSRWRDDKSYLYIKITVKEEYPKLFSVRRENDAKSKYFGPFSSSREVNDILKEVRRVFPFCTQKNIGKRPCFYSKIGLCNPCPNEIISIPDPQLKSQLKRFYRKRIRQVIDILSGNTDKAMNALYEQLTELSKQQNYEEAIILRNRIKRFERLITQQLFHIDVMDEYNVSEKSMNEIVRILSVYFPELKKAQRIECIDMSNLMIKNATASLVVATNGLIDKSQYRKFKIRNPKAKSDMMMLSEVLKRRLRNPWPRPDLIVVDGGKPQVRSAKAALQSLSETIPLIGLAKNPDRIVLGIPNLPTIRPSIHNVGFSLLRQLRDESHRFAKKFHVQLRNKSFIKDRL